MIIFLIGSIFFWFQEVEREISFRTESGLYYSYYKQLVNSPSIKQGTLQNQWSVSDRGGGGGLCPCESILFYYRPKRSFGQGNVFTGVCHSVNRGGVPDQAPPGTRQVHPPRPGRYAPLTRQVHPPRPGAHPPDQAGTPFWDQVPPRTGTLTRTRQIHPQDQAGTPPRPGAHPPDQAGTPPRTRYPPGPGKYTSPPDQAGTPPWDQAGTPPRTRYIPPWAQVHPPRTRYTPPGPGTPPGSSRPQNTVNDRLVCILLEYILVFIQFWQKLCHIIG